MDHFRRFMAFPMFGTVVWLLWVLGQQTGMDTVAAVLLLLCASGWLGGLGTMAVLASTGFAVGIGGPSRDMMIKKATPKGATGRVYGLVYCGLDVGMALGVILILMVLILPLLTRRTAEDAD